MRGVKQWRGIFFCVVMLALGFFAPVHGVIARQATPAATPRPDAAPQFSISALGDYENGYFDDVSIDPGKSLELSVEIRNFGSVPTELRTFKANAHSGANGGFVPGAQDETPFGSAAWSDYPSQTLYLQPGDSEVISFTVTVPNDTEPGQYISGLVVETAAPLAIEGSMDLSQIISYSISLSIVVPGEAVMGFEIGEPEVTSSASISVPVRNTGNYLVKPAGSVTITKDDGTIIHTAQVEMGSIYAHLETVILVILPDQIQPGQYLIAASLVDERSGASTELAPRAVVLPEPADPRGISISNAVITANDDEIVFANVDVTLSNGGQQIPASNVTLEVMRDGEQVDSFPLATNQVLLSGENQFVTRYLPADMWQSGEYTFSIKVSAVDPNGGQETVLLDEELDATIVVP
jgi:hypothetical protein